MYRKEIAKDLTSEQRSEIMPFIPEDFGQCTHVFQIPGPGGPAMVTYGFPDTGVLTMDETAEELHDAFVLPASLIGTVDSAATLIETRVLARRAGELLSGVFVSTSPGGGATSANSPQVALLYQKLTGFAGRNRRGRMYIPASPDVPESGVYPPNDVTNHDNAGAAFLAALVTAGLPMHLLHVSPADPPNIVTSLVSNPVVATQRRRIR